MRLAGDTQVFHQLVVRFANFVCPNLNKKGWLQSKFKLCKRKCKHPTGEALDYLPPYQSSESVYILIRTGYSFNELRQKNDKI